MRKGSGIERELASRVDQKVLRLFKHVERMHEYCRVRKVLIAELSEGRVQGRQMSCWVDSVKVALGSRGMTVEVGRQFAKDKEWRALVHM